MRRLATRTVLSHVIVAALSLLAFYVVIRMLVPTIFDERVAGGPPMRGVGLRATVAEAITTAAVVGGLLGIGTAAVVGLLSSRQLLRPITRIRAATRLIAAGNYDTAVETPAEQELAELATDVNTLGARLAQIERTRVQLIADVAHEMRTPLTVIDGTLEGMIDGVIAVTPDALAGLEAESRRLRRLAEDFSSLARAQERRFDLAVEPTDLALLVAATTSRLRPQFEDAGIALAVDVPPLPVTVDPDRIMQVLTNVLGNALAATDRGGWVRVTGARDRGLARLDVADSGEGLSHDDVERVFERFFRVHQRRTGSGIGLTISRELMRAHGGDLTARSEGLGRGAVFQLSVPLARASDSGQAPRPLP